MAEIQQMPKEYLPLHPDVAAFLHKEKQLFIAEKWLPARSGRTFVTYDPSTGVALAEVAEGDEADVDLAVQAARAAFDDGPWYKQFTAAERGRLLYRLADLIEERREIFAQIDSLDNGKPFQTTFNADVPKSAEHLRYYSGWPTKIEGSTIPVSAREVLNYTVREPVGVCGLIVPWNYPLRMAIWKVAPALAAGNCIVLKPAEQTPLSALYLAELTREAGFPRGVVNVVTGFGETAGAALVQHPGVDKISFTGSTEVARKITRSSADTLKHLSLELGGKSPNIVCADADLEKAVPGATWAIFGNNGQSCGAGSRLYVHRTIFDQVIDGIVAQSLTIRLGPGMHREQPDLGPVVSQEQLDRILEYVQDGHKCGGRAAVGGNRASVDQWKGYFVEPTLLVDVPGAARVATEEIFGPVVCAMPFDDDDEVLKQANNSRYGLAAGLWTRDLDKAHRFAARLQAGTIWINTWGATDAASPFGGYKQSGYGRELGKEAMDIYTQLKSVWIKVNGL